MKIRYHYEGAFIDENGDKCASEEYVLTQNVENNEDVHKAAKQAAFQIQKLMGVEE